MVVYDSPLAYDTGVYDGFTVGQLTAGTAAMAVLTATDIGTAKLTASDERPDVLT